MTLTPLAQTNGRRGKNSSFYKNDVAGRFTLPFGLQTTYRFLQTYLESSFPDGSEHIFVYDHP
jgi:hypothetical protein